MREDGPIDPPYVGYGFDVLIDVVLPSKAKRDGSRIVLQSIVPGMDLPIEAEGPAGVSTVVR